jgi:hypothetical protein
LSAVVLKVQTHQKLESLAKEVEVEAIQVIKTSHLMMDHRR